MPRPKSKEELLELSKSNYLKLLQLIDSMPEDKLKKEFPAGFLNRNVKDVIGHLHHWHLMFLEWYKVGMSGQKPEMPAKSYTWKTVPELNKKIWEKYKNESLRNILRLFDESFTNVQKIISKHSNEELFEKKRYKWTGTTSLGAYLISATSSHYDWAIKLIKKCTK